MDFSFNLADLPEPTNDFSPIPAGEYQATIKDAELKMTKNGTGQYIKLKIQVDGPTHQNRVIFTNLNIRNQNETAQSIGQAQLGQIMRAAGISSVTDPDQLIGTTLLIKVSIREAQNGYDPQNEVKGYKSLTGSTPPPLNPAKPAAKKSAAGAPPWANKG